MQPFLEVLTRTFPGRPKFLQRNRESLKLLGKEGWTQRIIMDDETRGCEWANQNLASIDAVGDWVWVLDDDDVCCYADLVRDLREIVTAEQPDVVMVRAYHAKYLMLPPKELWGQRPRMAQVGGACAITRLDIWQKYRSGWVDTYAADFWFINGMWDAGLKFAWLPVTAAFQTQENLGAAEDAR